MKEVKKGKLLLQFQQDILQDSFPDKEDFSKAFVEEVNTFFTLLSDILVKKANQKGFLSSMTFEVMEAGAFMDICSYVLKVKEDVAVKDSGEYLVYRLPTSIFKVDRVYCYNFGHGILITFCSKDDRVIMQYKITPIGLKTFNTRKKIGIEEL